MIGALYAHSNEGGPATRCESTATVERVPAPRIEIDEGRMCWRRDGPRRSRKGVRNESPTRYAYCVADRLGRVGAMRRKLHDAREQPSAATRRRPTRRPRPPVGTRGSPSDALGRHDAPDGRPTFDELPDVLTVEEAASFLRIGRRQMYQALARGDIYSAKIGRTIRIPKAGILAWLAGPTRADTREGG